MFEESFPLALTYDDVLLIPQRSRVASRSNVDTGGHVTPSIRLAVPIISANMDTVSEWRMAVAMAQFGGIGVIHRFLTIEEQIDQVRRVKRSESYVIESPWTINADATVGRAAEIFHDRGVNGLPVVDEDNRLQGLITRRDLVATVTPDTPVRAAMTPRDRLTVAVGDVSLDEARSLMVGARVEKLPVVDAEGRLNGLITLKDIQHLALFPNATKDSRGRLRVGAAIGVRGDYLERARACAEAGADLLCLDIAHGHAEHALRATTEIRRTVDVELIAGNVATPAGARDLIDAGAHAIKVGVGPGSVCTTRIIAGVGVPQLSAVIACAAVCHEADVPMCADGGIRVPADVAKAIGAGADTVMVGNLLAGTTESPGTLLERDGRMLKVHRGMASRGGMDRRERADVQVIDADERARVQHSVAVGGAASEASEFGRAVPEGVEAVVPYRGHVSSVLAGLVGGLRSAMSYSNALDTAEFRDNARFVRVTAAGMTESHPHDVEV